MFHISHKQTTAYHPESNGAVKRLHRRLKDALRASTAVATWSEELPFELLVLRAQLWEDTGLSPAEAVFGAPVVLPNKFLQKDEFSVDANVKKFKTTLDAPAFSLPRHNSSTQLLAELPDDLLRAPFVWSSCLSTAPTAAPTPSCGVDPAPSPSGSGRGTRSSLSAA
jgi:hypothetical protein